jgi:uncharacterized membrane protein
MVASAIPVINFLVPVILPIVFAGLMLACQQQDQGGEISISTVGSAFSNRQGHLALLGVAYLIESISIMILMLILIIVILSGFESILQLEWSEPVFWEIIFENSVKLLLAALIGLMLFVPVFMALLFAPALVVFHKMNAFEAMLASMKACLLNVLPFLIYGIVGMALMIIASIPLLLGWLVLIPILVASIYVSYKDIFGDNPIMLESCS